MSEIEDNMRPPTRCAPAANVVCPIDGAPLQAVSAATLRCAHGHSFDRARAGYTNLLVVQHKASRDPGDSKNMVAARRRFLAAGHYALIAAHVSEVVLRLAGQHPDRRPCIVDAGCGEGYYLAAIVEATERAENCHLQLAGIDISKWAIQAAAKRTSVCFWAVASNRHLPFTPGSVDLILSLFGFPLWDCFAAAQPAGGRVLLVDPGPAHLIELRRVIYPEVVSSPPPDLEAAERAGYRLEDTRHLTFSFALSNAAAIADLLAMTPHDHRAPPAGREALSQLDRLSITADVVIRQLVRS